MQIPKPAAALTSGLLAAKGAARPAMRRQTITGLGNARAAPPVDDLGWNDMGHDLPAPAAPEPAPPESSSPVALRIATLSASLGNDAGTAPQPAAPIDVKLPKAKTGQIRQLFTVSSRKQPAPAPAPATSRKSAFTLRIDAERHLRLRLLSAVSNRSAQQLLITALDALIAAHPDIEQLAADPKARSALAETGTD